MDPLSSVLIFAQSADMVEPVGQQSYLAWAFESLGPLYGLGLPLAGFVVFVGACLVVVLNRRPAVIAAYLPVAAFPFLLGCFGTIHGFISAFSVIAMSSMAPDPAEYARGISMALFSALVGFLVTFPTCFVISLGLFFRAITSPDTNRESGRGNVK